MPKKTNITAIDLFCGVGGLTQGFKREGIDVKLGIDIDPDCKYPYEKNNDTAFLEKDVSKVQPRTIRGKFDSNSVRLLAGCAPCQPFSSYSNRYRNAKSASEHGVASAASGDAQNWKLLYSFLRLARWVKPELITMENVVPLRKHQVFTDFVSGLEKLSYHVTDFVVNCSDYGVPQKRRRLVLFASIYGPVKLCPNFSEEPKTVKDWIGDLPSLVAGGVNEADPVHRAGGLSDTNLERIKASKPGGSWRDWDPKLITKCHQKKKGKSYSPVYGRMDWKIAPTITTQFFTYGTGRFGHPEQHRAISIREGALLQTFPRDYEFVEDSQDISFGRLGRLIGNAVPVNLGRAIARSLANHVEANNIAKTGHG